MNIRTDLALEAKELADKNIDGIEQRIYEYHNMTVTKIKITSSETAKILNKDKGIYITMEFPKLVENFNNTDQNLEIIGKHIRQLLPKDGLILVVGMGNLNITPDALGPKSSEKVLATRHITGELAKQTGLDKLRSVAVISPGVLGQTGVETFEIVTSIVERIHPKAIIAIDALASRRIERLGCTLQISDTGISPGAGIGNRRFPINKKTIGIPVIAIGIPTVVDALTLIKDTLPKDYQERNLFNDISQKGKNMVVTPKEIDVLIERGSQIIGMAVNSALHNNFSLEDIVSLIN